MNERLYIKKIKGKPYFYLQRTFREKVDSSDSGKTRGTGKSRVVTKTTYLGDVSSILKKLTTLRARTG